MNLRILGNWLSIDVEPATEVVACWIEVVFTLFNVTEDIAGKEWTDLVGAVGWDESDVGA